MNLTTILDECLAELRAGASTEKVLARHAAHAVELAPMLAAAARLQSLAGYRLSDAQRAQAKATLRRTLVARPSPAAQPRFDWRSIFAPARGLAMAGIVTLLLCVTLSATAVAASQPGDLAYRLRVAAERMPAALQTAPAGRAAAELTVADRRLADLGRHLAAAGQADNTALGALLQSDIEAARRAVNMPDPAQRQRIAERIARHGDQLADLAEDTPNLRAAAALRQAAARATILADQVRLGTPPGSGAGPIPPQATATATSTPTPTAAEPQQEAAPPTPTATPTPTPTASPIAGEHLPPTSAGGVPPPPAQTRVARESATLPPLPPPAQTRVARESATPPPLPPPAQTRVARESASPPPLVATRQARQSETPPPPSERATERVETATARAETATARPPLPPPPGTPFPPPPGPRPGRP